MPGTLHAFDLLQTSPADPPDTSLVVLFGEDGFLRQLSRKTMLDRFEADGDFASLAPDSEWRDVHDEVQTSSLFGSGGRVAVVREADAFVKRYRERLEALVTGPPLNGWLILEVQQWPANTRLYKLCDEQALQVACRVPESARGKRKYPDIHRVHRWIREWAKQQHELNVSADAADLLWELAGPHFGLVDQELAKLALYVEPGEKVSAERVGDVVGGWRTRTTWDMIDAAVNGDSAGALRQLDHLLQAGEYPAALMGQIGWSLRRFAAATRHYERAMHQGGRADVKHALEQAGFPKWSRDRMALAEGQLRKLGRYRAGELYRWLLDTDLALKGSHAHPARARFALELLLLRLVREKV